MKTYEYLIICSRLLEKINCELYGSGFDLGLGLKYTTFIYIQLTVYQYQFYRLSLILFRTGMFVFIFYSIQKILAYISSDGNENTIVMDFTIRAYDARTKLIFIMEKGTIHLLYTYLNMCYGISGCPRRILFLFLFRDGIQRCCMVP